MKKNYTLTNGVNIPSIGYGTWQSPQGKLTEDGVSNAIKYGYRLIDGAAVYGNEESVGKGIIASGISRSELFVTSKVWNTDRGYETTLKAFEKTLSDLQLDYLDLYLIHWPANKKQFANWDEINKATWQALIDLYKAGKIKAIGVSNFMPHHLESLMKMEIAPMVNQIEFHPGYLQEEIVEYCQKNNILVEAWSPLGSGRVLNDESLVAMAEKYNTSPAQLCIAWCLAHNTLPLPKSVTESRIKQNLDVMNINISSEDIGAINKIEQDCFSGIHPDTVDF